MNAPNTPAEAEIPGIASAIAEIERRNAPQTHFHSSDERFCGSVETFRGFTFDPNKVTCEHCKANDTLFLSPQGLAAVAQLEGR